MPTCTQERSYEDIVEAVETFVVTFEPPLLPALEGASFETQISIADDPPDYDSANRVLKVRTSSTDYFIHVNVNRGHPLGITQDYTVDSLYNNQATFEISQVY